MSEDLLRRRVSWALNSVRSSELGPIEASRMLPPLLRRLGLDPLDDDLVSFVALDSETDHLPIGRVQELWAEEALEEKRVAVRCVIVTYGLIHCLIPYGLSQQRRGG